MRLLYPDAPPPPPDAPRLALRYGNRHRRVANPKRSNGGRGRHLNCHAWEAFVELLDPEGRPLPAHEQRRLIEHVTFRFGDRGQYFNGEEKRSNPPFSVKRVGWGYFDVPIEVAWRPEVGPGPLRLDHELSFEGSGRSEVMDLDFAPQRAPLPALGTALTADARPTLRRPASQPPAGRPRWR